MTRRPRTSRKAENRLTALESDANEERVLGWQELMDYAIECGETENPPTVEEAFGEGVVMPNWVDDLPQPGERRDTSRTE